MSAPTRSQAELLFGQGLVACDRYLRRKRAAAHSRGGAYDCEHGHMECAATELGACTDELLHLLEDAQEAQEAQAAHAPQVAAQVAAAAVPAPTQADAVEVVPNDTPLEREGRDGRIHVSHRRTWQVVYQGEHDSLHTTKRDALARAQELRLRHQALRARAGLGEGT